MWWRHCRSVSCSSDVWHRQLCAWGVYDSQALSAQSRRTADDARPSRAVRVRRRHSWLERPSDSLRQQPAATSESQLRHCKEARVPSSQVRPGHNSSLEYLVKNKTTCCCYCIQFCTITQGDVISKSKQNERHQPGFHLRSNFSDSRQGLSWLVS